MLDEKLSLLNQALKWIEAGHKVGLATVIQCFGSSPRPKGAQLIVRDDGLHQGSVSGGCIEGDVIVAVGDSITENRVQRLSFGVSQETAVSAGLACGGKIEILAEPIAEGFFTAQLIRQLILNSNQGRRSQVVLDCRNGRTWLEQTKTAKGLQSDQIRLVYAPPYRLIIVGAVHIAQHLTEIAKRLDFRVYLCDPRNLFHQDARVADGVIRSSLWPDEAMEEWGPDFSTAVVTLTHDPKLDEPALVAALKSDAFYIAALGSKKTHAARLERLRAYGFDQREVDRIHGPAGLDIGSVSPAEIALSIAAQMIAKRRSSEKET